jgi:hypothetical protein
LDIARECQKINCHEEWYNGNQRIHEEREDPKKNKLMDWVSWSMVNQR